MMRKDLLVVFALIIIWMKLISTFGLITVPQLDDGIIGRAVQVLKKLVPIPPQYLLGF
jgi:hypothetical protein